MGLKLRFKNYKTISIDLTQLIEGKFQQQYKRAHPNFHQKI